MSTSPKPSVPPGTIEFEITDFETARRALELPPEGLERIQTFAPNYWEERRRKPQPSDRALTSEAMQWLLTLPADLRPREVCNRYPRVANAIAESWIHPERLQILDAFLTDSRGNRRGFPPEVERELRALRGAADSDPRVKLPTGG